MPCAACQIPDNAAPPRRNHTLVLVALFFLAGALSINCLAIGVWLWGVAIIGLGLAIVVPRSSGLHHSGLALCVFALGALYANAAFVVSAPAPGTYDITATVSGGMTLRTDSRVSFAITEICLDDKPVSGKASVSLHYEQTPPALFDGASIRFDGRVYHPNGKTGAPQFDTRMWMRQQGFAFGVAAFKEVEVFNTPETAPITDPAYRARCFLQNVYTRTMGDNGRFAMALLFGQRDELSDMELSAFETLGIAHIMSVSGLHVTLVGGLLLLLLSRLHVSRSLSMVLLALLLAVYCAVTGFSAASVRAAVMLVLYTIGHTCHIRGNSLTLLAGSMIAVLLINPLHAHSAGFVLSFCAMLAISLYATPLYRWLSRLFPALPRRHSLRSAVLTRLQNGFKATLAVSLSAQLGVLLPTATYFHALPTYGILINIMIVPFVSAVLIPLYAAVLPLSVLPVVGRLSGMAASAATDGLLALIQLFAKLPYASIRVGEPALVLCLGIGLAFAMLSPRAPGGFRQKAIAAVLAVAIGVGGSWMQHPSALRYIQLSAGQADSALLLDDDKTILIDTGDDAYDAMAYLLAENRHVDALLLTHLHLDHAGGVEALLESGIRIDHVYLPIRAKDQQIDNRLHDLPKELQAAGIPVSELASGDELRYNRSAIRVLWPERDTIRTKQNANQYSLVLSIDLDGYRLLHMSDMPGTFENLAAVPADVLKLAHHGSEDSSRDAFLAHVSPSFALISASAHDSAWHDSSTVDRLLSHGILPLHTGWDGDITLSVEDGTLSVIPYLERTVP